MYEGLPPPSLMELSRRTQAGSQEDFRAQLGGWCLVGPPITIADEWNYRTMSARSVRHELPGGEIMILRDTYAAYPLKKQKPGPFADTILIGRASSNDVQIPHNSVSKLHARVRYGQDGRPTLSDAGSSNGTVVRDVTLPEGQWLPLHTGDVVTIGTCALRVLDPDHLYGLVKKLVR